MQTGTQPAASAPAKPVLVRDVFFRFLERLDIKYFFGNPGTTELPLVDGVNDHPGIRYVLGLHEDVSVAHAMGYARMSGKPGVVNLHVAPGLGHGLGNIYNAWRARIPLVVTVGQHHTGILLHEPILTAELAQMARPFTKWAYDVRRTDELGVALQRAFKEVTTPPVAPVFLSFPTDVLLAPQEGPLPSAEVSRIGATIADADAIERAARVLASASNPVVIAGDGVGLADAWEEAAAVAEALGAPVYTEELSTLWNFPSDHPHYAGALPNISATMRARFDGVDVALFAGFTAQAPVSRHDGAGPLVPAHVRVVAVHHDPWEVGKNQAVEAGVLGDVKRNLAALADALRRITRGERSAIDERAKGIRAASADRAAKLKVRAENARREGTLSAAYVASELAQILPPRAVMVDEAISNREAFVSFLKFGDPLAYWGAKGLSLGHSTGAALGIKLAAPDRTVVNVVGDGSLMYYPQALWSLANVKVPVLVLVVNNASYRVLKLIWNRWGGPWGDSPALPPGLNFGEPKIDFVKIADSMGVAGERVSKSTELRAAVERGLAADAPYLLDVRVDQPDRDIGAS
jgi:benzoylformate decarboxylase